MAGNKKPPDPPDSGISDLDDDLRRKMRLSRRACDDYTPITNLGDLGPAISAIKRGQDKTALAVESLDTMVRKEMKPQLREVRDGFIELRTEHKTTKARLRILETDTKTLSIANPQSHDCYHEDEIVDLKEGFKEARAGIATVQTGVATVVTEHKRTKEETDKEVQRIDGRSKMIFGVAATVGLFVLASVGGFTAAFYTTQANVDHIASEQQKIRGDVSTMRDVHINASSKLREAAERVEEVAQRVEKAENGDGPLDFIWCDLSPQERRRQERLRGSDKIPQRRCP